MHDKSAELKPSGNTIASVLMGMILLVFLALSSPSWGAAPYLEALVLYGMLFMCFTDRTNSYGQGHRGGKAEDNRDNCGDGEVLALCLETVDACHHLGENADENGWGDAGAEYFDCDYY